MLALLGLCKGHHVKTRDMKRPDGTEYKITEHSVLLQVEQFNQYDMPESKIIAVRMSKSQVDNGVDKIWDQLKERQVSADVYIQAWASKAGNAGYDYWLSSKGHPLNLQQVPATNKPQAVANG